MTPEQEKVWDRLKHVEQAPYTGEYVQVSLRWKFKRYLGMTDEEIDEYFGEVEKL